MNPFILSYMKDMKSKSILGVTFAYHLQYADRCRACGAVRGGQVEDTYDIDLDSMKHKGYLIFGLVHS